jgi:hypothetical protein
MPELDPKPRVVESRVSRWKRLRHYFLLAMLGIITMQWALKELTWRFGWTPEPVQDRLGHIFDAFVILAAGLVVFIFALRHITRKDETRQAALDRLHDQAVKAKEAKNVHA